MDNERIDRIIAAIVRLVATMPSREGLGARIHHEMRAQGYDDEEIVAAVGILARANERMAVPGGAMHAATVLRPLMPAERLRLTDDAIALFGSWQASGACDGAVIEKILQQVASAAPGEVDAVELRRIARELAPADSPLATLLEMPEVRH